MKTRYLWLILLLQAFTQLSMAQTRTVGGQVLDERGQGLPGAGITAKGTSVGTVTDPDGRFRLDVPEVVTTLVVQAVGYTTQDVAATGTDILVRMQPQAQGLNETVVTALGIRRNKNDLAYSAQKVAGEEITRTRESNFINSLSGKVAGLDIKRNNNLGGSTNVVMRGMKNLSGSNQALFVIDGVPINNFNNNSLDQQRGRNGYDYGNAAADIDPDNIESITVLKGAAATALYGERAGNGVIMITTKKGLKSGFNIVVNTGVSTGSIDKSTFIKYQKQYGAGYGAYYESPDGYFYYRDVLGNGTSELVVPVSEDASMGAHFDPNLMVYDWKSLDPYSPSYHQKTPWVAAPTDPIKFFVHPVSSNTNITFTGGNEQGGLSIGYTRTTDKGILENSSIIKDLFAINGTYNLTRRLSMSGTVNVSNINGKGRYGTGYSGFNASVAGNLRQWWQTNVDVKELREAYFRGYKDVRYNATWNYSDPDDRTPIFWDNPYWVLYENYEQDHRLRSFGNVSLNYQVTDWMDVMGRLGFDTYSELEEERAAITTVGSSIYSRFNQSFDELNYDLLINFHKDLHKDWKLSGLLGTNIRRTNYENIYASTNGGLVIPGLYALSNSANPVADPKENLVREGLNGVFGAATVNYKSLVLLDLTLRRDQSSTLPKDDAAYWYPSASLGFVFSRLVPQLDWLTFGKARLNYAVLGFSTTPYRTTDIFEKSGVFGGNTMYQVYGTKRNPALKPSFSSSVEGGLELSFLKNRAGLDVTYYSTDTKDQILAVAQSSASGFNYEDDNIGLVRNRGIEVTAYGIPVRTRNFSWTINVNFARNRNKVIELRPGTNNYEIAAFQGSITNNATKGYTFGTLRGTDFVYDAAGNKMVDDDGYYMITSTANNVIGDVNPDWTGGVSNTLKYKSLSFSFLIDVKQGGDVFSLDRYYGLATGLPEETAGTNDLGNPMRNDLSAGGGVILEGVTADGQPNKKRIPVEYGTFGYVHNPDKAFIYDASYVKLREVNLTWSLPGTWIKALRYVKGIDASAYGRNLWIIHKNLPDADPEDGLSSGNAQGFQTGSYPTARIYGFNLRFIF